MSVQTFLFQTDGNTGTYFNDYCNWKKIPEFREFVEHSPAAEIAGSLMGCEVRKYFYFYV